MGTTAWGSGLSADEELAFSGHVELTATRIASSSLLLDWVRPSAGWLYYWPMDEGSGSYIHDQGSLHRDGQIEGTVLWETANPWMGSAHWAAGWGNSWRLPAPSGQPDMRYFTHEFWGYAYADTQERTALCQFGSPYTPMIRLNHGSVAGQLYITTNGVDALAPPGSVTTGMHHFAFVCAPDNLRIYVDGTRVAQSTAAPGAANGWSTMIIGRNPTNYTRYWTGMMDEVAVYTSAKYTDNFQPHRYEQGTVTLVRPSAEGARVVTGVDWVGTFGAGYGSVYRVQVNTGTDVSPSWVTVGGDNPTSPLTGLSVTVQPGVTRWLRVYMEPRADATKSATPVLSALRVTHEAAASVVVPMLYATGRYF